jgi:REP element-mobilizing transposase RayT/DNA-binding transcriptional regulator YiaG
MFADDEDREGLYELLDTGIASHKVDCHQDVQMGNHVHLLLEGPITDVSKLLWFVSHRYALAYNRRHGRINHLIGRRFHASDVPDPFAARAVAVYIAMNPVRAGLCAHPRDWAHSSYRTHADGEFGRPHLTTDYVQRLFANRATTFKAAVEAAVRLNTGGRPALHAILPSATHLTAGHIRHARQVYGYTVDEIAAHYGRSTRTITRWLSDAYELPRLKRLSTSQ